MKARLSVWCEIVWAALRDADSVENVCCTAAGDPVLGFYSPFGPLIAKPRCRPAPPTTFGASCIDPLEHVHAHYGPAEHARQLIMGRPSSCAFERCG